MIRDRIHTGVLALSSAPYVPLVHAARHEALTEYDCVVRGPSSAVQVGQSVHLKERRTKDQHGCGMQQTRCYFNLWEHISDAPASG